MLTTECTLTTGASATTDQPTLACGWATEDGTTIGYDIKPTANYDSPVTVIDSTLDVTTVATSQICTELWKLTATSIACVEMTGSAQRKFDTGDADGDIVLDYVTYQMHAKFGNVLDTDNVYRFDEQAVNLANFLATDTNFALNGLQSALGVSVVAGLLQTLF